MCLLRSKLTDLLDILQLQSGAVYLLVLDAFHGDAVTIEKVEWHS
jgi:hypothetical protein